MTKKIFLYAITIAFISCNKIDTNESITENHIDSLANPTSQPVNFIPLFLGLSPKMTENIFYKEIENLNNIGKLDNNIFLLKINSVTYGFTIEKTKNSIKLNSSSITIKRKKNLSYKISDSLIHKYYIEKEEIFNVFKNKYQLYDIQVPVNINLDNFNLIKDDYKLFKDVDKFILVGCSIIGNSVSSPEEQIEEYNNSINGNSPNIFAELQGKEVDPNNSYHFGIEIEINYLHIDDMKSLLNEMLEESVRIKKIKTEQRKLESDKNEFIDNNINEI
ncbi:MAG: hypothetical protein RBR78_07665 [Flavobacteriaceae bacterium]|jgi:hypothetical protein|nr:hypothetical protein [Flavobacteriaceae bacterium]